jgi:F0F1-type ATP synthase membrane subunit b/b'
MRYEAQRLQKEAKQELENARKEVEEMILNEEKK